MRASDGVFGLIERSDDEAGFEEYDGAVFSGGSEKSIN